MMESNEGFSHEEKMEAGSLVFDLLDALDDPDLQQHMIDMRAALQKAVRHLEDRGVSTHDAWLAFAGIILSPILPD